MKDTITKKELISWIEERQKECFYYYSASAKNNVNYFFKAKYDSFDEVLKLINSLEQKEATTEKSMLSLKQQIALAKQTHLDNINSNLEKTKEIITTALVESVECGRYSCEIDIDALPNWYKINKNINDWLNENSCGMNEPSGSCGGDKKYFVEFFTVYPPTK